jgi:hypothetical protein
MKTNHFTTLVTAVFGLAAFSTTGYATNERFASVVMPPRMAMVTITVADAHPGPAPRLQFAAATVAPSSDVASARWSDIKDCTYDMRAQFFAGLSRLEAIVDAQVSQLIAKRAAMKSTTDTKDWDFAMKEMEDARTNLKSIRAEASKATPETWDQEKDKVGQAWLRTQAAFTSVKSSTTS